MATGERLEASVPTRASAAVLPLYVAAIFTSALLLFAVQPMFTRLVLPRLGGSPSVWSVAMVFFQAMLLAGYAYAHLVMRLSRPVLAVAIHLALLLAAALTLPLSIASGWGEPPQTGEAFWLLGLFAVSIGLPFFALSANNPLLQAWFVRTGHRSAADPYWLYAASNVGSLLALLAYPVLLEPALPLREQLGLWSWGFYALIVLIAGCGFFVPRTARRAEAAGAAAAAAPTAADYARWIALSAVPSGLLVAVTAHISTDVAAAPLLWVLPLSLYLITWIIVFQTNPVLPHRWIVGLAPVAIAAVVVLTALPVDDHLLLRLGAHLLAFFILAMACHGELSRLRPHPRYLTAFYLSLSAGGVVGGIFAGLIAPRIFSWVAEYPILLVLSALCLPRSKAPAPAYARLAWPVAAVAAALVLPGLLGWVPSATATSAIRIGAAGVAVSSLALVGQPGRTALLVALALALLHLYPAEAGRYRTVRSFFGVHKISETPDGRYRLLHHGTTLHGAQMIRDEAGRPMQGRPEPLTYYHETAPLTEAIRAVRERKGGPIRAALVGLGTGSLACQKGDGERWRFFEIDPDVVRIARERFGFMAACAPEAEVVLGDARLSLAREPDGAYDIVLIDAFSSDSVPVHLLTKEAMALYRSKLAPGGAVVLHVSNKYLDIASVAVGIATANGLRALVFIQEEDEEHEYKFASDVVMAVAEVADAGKLATRQGWEIGEPEPGQRVWTDDYSNILGALLRR